MLRPACQGPATGTGSSAEGESRLRHRTSLQRVIRRRARHALPQSRSNGQLNSLLRDCARTARATRPQACRDSNGRLQRPRAAVARSSARSRFGAHILCQRPQRHGVVRVEREARCALQHCEQREPKQRGPGRAHRSARLADNAAQQLHADWGAARLVSRARAGAEGRQNVALRSLAVHNGRPRRTRGFCTQVAATMPDLGVSATGPPRSRTRCHRGACALAIALRAEVGQRSRLRLCPLPTQPPTPRPHELSPAVHSHSPSGRCPHVLHPRRRLTNPLHCLPGLHHVTEPDRFRTGHLWPKRI